MSNYGYIKLDDDERDKYENKSGFFGLREGNLPDDFIENCVKYRQKN